MRKLWTGEAQHSQVSTWAKLAEVFTVNKQGAKLVSAVFQPGRLEPQALLTSHHTVCFSSQPNLLVALLRLDQFLHLRVDHQESLDKW